MTLPVMLAHYEKLRAAREERVKALKAALIKTHGNVSDAAKLVPLSRPQAQVIIREEGLAEFARDLRRAAGVSLSGLGRPWPKTNLKK